MIYGIGNDAVEIGRIRDKMENERFMAFVYTRAEREAFGGNAQKLAGCFAAKEALSKALGTGVRGFSLDEVSVLRDELGKPYFLFEGSIARIVRELAVTPFVALTNTKELAIANVILEKRIWP